LVPHRTLPPLPTTQGRHLSLPADDLVSATSAPQTPISAPGQAIAPLFEAAEEQARLHEARVLWSCLHGIVSLELTSKMGIGESIASLTESLIGNYVFALIERGARIAAD
jgi:hypothetical protein